jgi:hypothetical protein
MVYPVPHPKMQMDRRKLPWGKTARNLRRQTRQKPLHGVIALHGG